MASVKFFTDFDFAIIALSKIQYPKELSRVKARVMEFLKGRCESFHYCTRIRNKQAIIGLEYLLFENLSPIEIAPICHR